MNWFIEILEFIRLDKTANEVLELYNKALSFINFLSQKLESK
jgi:hypothetical protein